MGESGAAVWRWQEDSAPGTPDGNMAADALLLREVQGGAMPAVRVYTWDRPSVSFGRLQKEEVVRAAYPNLPLIRRPTGGRAVRHGDDLCVTVAARLSDLPPSEDGGGVLSSYRLLAGALLDAFRSLGAAAAFGSAQSLSNALSPVDCFAAAARCDIIDSRTGRKLAGCAQRREADALLQQMSIPETSRFIGLETSRFIGLPQGGENAFPDFIAAVRASLATRLCIAEWEQPYPPASSLSEGK